MNHLASNAPRPSSAPLRILVTGPLGFVETRPPEQFVGRGLRVRSDLRATGWLPAGVEPALIGEIGPHTKWGAALNGVDAVVHLAARVHVMRDQAAAEQPTPTSGAPC